MSTKPGPITTELAKRLVFTRGLRLTPDATYVDPRVATIAQELGKLHTTMDKLYAELLAIEPENNQATEAYERCRPKQPRKS